jgi:Patched family
VLVGGLSTFLGVVPLIFSQSDLMKALFYGFWGMVLLGLSHGIILLPVILSCVGPLDATPENAVVMGNDSEPLEEKATEKVRRDFLSSPGSACQSDPTSDTSVRHHLDSDVDVSRCSSQRPRSSPLPAHSEISVNDMHHNCPQSGPS